MRLLSLFASLPAGLDVQADAVRLMEIGKNRRDLSAARIVVVGLQHHVFNGDMVEHWEGLRAALEELAITAGIRMGKVTVNFPVSLIKADWSEVVKAKNRQESEAMLRKSINPDYLQKYVNCICAAGFRPTVVDLDIFALQRVAQLVAVSQQKKVAVLYIQLKRTMLIVLENDKIISYQIWHDCPPPCEIENELSKSKISIDRMILINSKNADAHAAALGARFSVEIVLDANRSLYALAAGLAMRVH